MSLWLWNFCTSSYSMRTLHNWSKIFQPLVYMWSKPTPSFSNICALFLKIWAFYWAPFSFFCGLILLLVTEISEQPRYIFANISGLGEYFSKRIFALKHRVQAGRFEYHEPYIQNNYYYYKASVLFRSFWIFIRTLCVISSWIKTMCNSYVANGDLIQRPL